MAEPDADSPKRFSPVRAWRDRLVPGSSGTMLPVARRRIATGIGANGDLDRRDLLLCITHGSNRTANSTGPKRSTLPGETGVHVSGGKRLPLT